LRFFACRAFSLLGTMASCGRLFAYSDRIVRDFHPIPFYPSAEGTQKVYLYYICLERKVNAEGLALFSRRTMNYSHACYGTCALLRKAFFGILGKEVM